MGQRVVIVVLLAALVWFAATLVRVENQRYALQVGMCRDAQGPLADTKCLKSVQTRTAWWWHLFYALTD